MYTKIKKVCESCLDDLNTLRLFGWVFLISLVIFVGFYTYKGGWNSTLHYPEESYKEIENEATRIFNSLKNGEQFESDYIYDIDSFSSSTKSLNFSLYGNDNTSVKVFITSLGSSDSEITIKRGSNNFVSHFIKDIISLMAIPVLIGLLVIIVIWITSLSIWFISFIIHKILSCIHKK